jgi:phage shock protein PspC (stress-responsive transcriptional regulator)
MEPLVENTTETTNPETTAPVTTPVRTPAPAAKRMLYRHPVHRMVGGVCGGLAEVMDWDPALVRILWVVATLATGGGGILAYVALWMLLPVGSAAQGQVSPAALELNDRNLARAAYVLIALGAVWLLANVGVLPWLWGGFWRVMAVLFWPALLVGAGYFLLRSSGKVGQWNWRTTGTRMKESVNGALPTRESIGTGMRRARERFPLKRSRTDRIFMGVCGGIGKRIGIDANLVRLVWVAFSVGSVGMGVLIYVIAGLLLPEETVTDLTPYDEPHDVTIIDARTTNI